MFSCDCSSVMRLKFCAVVCSSFRVLGRFGRDWLNNVQHLGDRFAKLRHALAREGLPILGATGCLSAASNVDRGFT